MALDVTVQAQILHRNRDQRKKHVMAVMLIFHDLTVARQFADNIQVIQRGQVQEHGNLVEEGVTSDVMDTPKTDNLKRLIRAAFEVAT